MYLQLLLLATAFQHSSIGMKLAKDNANHIPLYPDYDHDGPETLVSKSEDPFAELELGERIALPPGKAQAEDRSANLKVGERSAEQLNATQLVKELAELFFTKADRRPGEGFWLKPLEVGPVKQTPHSKQKNRTAKNPKKSSAKTRSRTGVNGRCYFGIGCFESDFHQTGLLPDRNLPAETFFVFYQRRNRYRGVRFTYLRVEDPVKLITKDQWLVIVVHGFTSNSKADWAHDLKDKALDNIDCSVIIVDWGTGALQAEYKQAVINSQVPGRQIAKIVFQLMEKTGGKIDPTRVHWMGHSLGAQMSIYFWDWLKELTNGRRIAKITALDPAASFYEHNNFHVNTSMAEFVEVIHTSSGGDPLTAFGMTRPAGHVDFYMNGGFSPMPGCNAVLGAACSHSRAQLYYAEAIDIRRKCKFLSYSCTEDGAAYAAKTCVKMDENWSALSFNNTQNLPGRGMQFIDTRENSPFCIPLDVDHQTDGDNGDDEDYDDTESSDDDSDYSSS